MRKSSKHSNMSAVLQELLRRYQKQGKSSQCCRFITGQHLLTSRPGRGCATLFEKSHPWWHGNHHGRPSFYICPCTLAYGSAPLRMLARVQAKKSDSARVLTYNEYSW